MDKTTLGSAAILGIMYDLLPDSRVELMLTQCSSDSAHLTVNQYAF